MKNFAGEENRFTPDFTSNCPIVAAKDKLSIYRRRLVANLATVVALGIEEEEEEKLFASKTGCQKGPVMPST